jgi:AcrR family transcriptional regulator
VTRQARAEATYKAIIAAAAEVFSKIGYCGASLTQIIDRAGVSRGAFHYHFPSKEALASALIRDVDTAMEGIAQDIWLASPSAPTLERLIRSAFVVAATARTDKRIGIGFQLKAALGRVNPDTAADNRRQALLIDVVNAAMEEGDIRADLSAEEVGHIFWVSFFGNHLYSEAMGKDPAVTLAGVVRILLSGVCTDQSGAFFEHFADRLARGYAAPMPHVRSNNVFHRG